MVVVLVEVVLVVVVVVVVVIPEQAETDDMVPVDPVTVYTFTPSEKNPSTIGDINPGSKYRAHPAMYGREQDE